MLNSLVKFALRLPALSECSIMRATRRKVGVAPSVQAVPCQAQDGVLLTISWQNSSVQWATQRLSTCLDKDHGTDSSFCACCRQQQLLHARWQSAIAGEAGVSRRKARVIFVHSASLASGHVAACVGNRMVHVLPPSQNNPTAELPWRNQHTRHANILDEVSESGNSREQLTLPSPNSALQLELAAAHQASPLAHAFRAATVALSTSLPRIV